MSRAPARAAAKKPQDKVEVFDCEQRSEEWFALRLGTVTASVLSAVMSSSDEQRMRTKLLLMLAAEIMMKEPAETFCNAHMLRGIEMEPDAIAHYEFTRGIKTERVGFVQRTIRRVTGDLVVGCSPDALVGKDGLLQVKTMQPDNLVELIDSGRFPSEHKWQCHGEIFFTGRSWLDLEIFYKGFPIAPVFRIERNDALCRQIEDAVEKFYWDLNKLVERLEARRKR